MNDILEIAAAIRSDAADMKALRRITPEGDRPQNIIDLQNLHLKIEQWIEKNNSYQIQLDKMRHIDGTGSGDNWVRPAWIEKTNKTGTKIEPGSFDLELREVVKIFHHSFPTILSNLRTELRSVAEDIEQSIIARPSRKELRNIQNRLARITQNFQWLHRNERIYFISSEGNGNQSFFEAGPGTPDSLDKFSEELIAISDRLKRLEDKWREDTSLSFSEKAFYVSIVSLIVAAAALFFGIKY